MDPPFTGSLTQTCTYPSSQPWHLPHVPYKGLGHYLARGPGGIPEPRPCHS